MPGLRGNGAGDRTRTYDPRITNALLYQLSYSGSMAMLSTGGGYCQPPKAISCRQRRVPLHAVDGVSVILAPAQADYHIHSGHFGAGRQLW
jgi:hypothetical protein